MNKIIKTALYLQVFLAIAFSGICDGAEQQIKVTIEAVPEAMMNEAVQFGVSINCDWKVEYIKWNFGDGKIIKGESKSVSHTYREWGKKDVSVEVKLSHTFKNDEDDMETIYATGSDTHNITINAGRIVIKANPKALPVDGASQTTFNVQIFDSTGKYNSKYSGNISIKSSDKTALVTNDCFVSSGKGISIGTAQNNNNRVEIRATGDYLQDGIAVVDVVGVTSIEAIPDFVRWNYGASLSGEYDLAVIITTNPKRYDDMAIINKSDFISRFYGEYALLRANIGNTFSQTKVLICMNSEQISEKLRIISKLEKAKKDVESLYDNIDNLKEEIIALKKERDEVSGTLWDWRFKKSAIEGKYNRYVSMVRAISSTGDAESIAEILVSFSLGFTRAAVIEIIKAMGINVAVEYFIDWLYRKQKEELKSITDMIDQLQFLYDQYIERISDKENAILSYEAAIEKIKMDYGVKTSFDELISFEKYFLNLYNCPDNIDL